MAQRHEHRPGAAVPDAATYEQLNIFGHPTGIRIVVADAHPLPPAPRGHTWTLVDEATETRLDWLTTPGLRQP
jgi:hypothetical protein